METTKCLKCGKCWESDSDQAACIRLYDHCIVCAVKMAQESGLASWSIDEVLSEMIRFKDFNDILDV